MLAVIEQVDIVHRVCNITVWKILEVKFRDWLTALISIEWNIIIRSLVRLQVFPYRPVCEAASKVVSVQSSKTCCSLRWPLKIYATASKWEYTSHPVVQYNIECDAISKVEALILGSLFVPITKWLSINRKTTLCQWTLALVKIAVHIHLHWINFI
jgi:hypothetical protein